MRDYLFLIIQENRQTHCSETEILWKHLNNVNTSWLDGIISFTGNKRTKEVQMPELHPQNKKEIKYVYLDFGRTAPRYFEKEITAMVKAPRYSLRCNCRKADEGVN